MPFCNRSASTPRSVQTEMTLKEFKLWLMRFDVDNDGRLSRDELREAFRALNGRFTTWNSRRGVRLADCDGDGYVGLDEIENLVDFAERKFGLRIVVPSKLY